MTRKEWLSTNSPWLFRLGLIALLLGSALMLRTMGALPFGVLWPALVSLAYLMLTAGLSLRHREGFRPLADYGQSGLDIAWIYLFIRTGAGADSPFSLLFFLAVIQAANVRFLRGAILSAALSSLAYGLLLYLEYLSWASVQSGTGAGEILTALKTDYLFKGYVYGICLFIVAALSGILAERVRLKGRQLEAATRGWEEFRLSTGDILKRMGSGLMTLNASGQIRYCNKTGAEILALDEERIAGRAVADVFAGGIGRFGTLLREVLSAVNAGVPDDHGALRRLSDIRHEIAVFRDDGTEVPLGVSTTAVKDADGKLQGLIVIFQNLAEAKRTASRLLQMEQLESTGEHTKILLTMIQPRLAGIDRDIAGLAEQGLTGPALEDVTRDIRDRVDSVRRIIEDFMRYAKIELPQERKEDSAPAGPDDRHIVGQSPAFLKTMELVRQVSASESTVLIQGESGTGKELLAKEIHRLSKRNRGPFVSINCAALPETLLESELFGHVKGSFTGAMRDKDGLFRVADGGTFFLDEVSETSPAIQVKLLRVLQEREIVPVGGAKPIKIDIRLISATNADLSKAVEQGRFRSDLFYRLNVIPITVPPLRERKEDIPALAEFFSAKYCQRAGKPVVKISEQALDMLMGHQWPGNVRELENAIERVVVISDSLMMEPKDFPSELFGRQGGRRAGQEPDHRGGTLVENEIESIVEALKQSKGNKKKTAEKLGIHYATLYRKIKQYGING